MKENIYCAIMTVKIEKLLNKYILNACLYLKYILYVKEFLQLYSPEDCLNNMKLRVVDY